jgi:hypothetical protein
MGARRLGVAAYPDWKIECRLVDLFLVMFRRGWRDTQLQLYSYRLAHQLKTKNQKSNIYVHVYDTLYLYSLLAPFLFFMCRVTYTYTQNSSKPFLLYVYIVF